MSKDLIDVDAVNTILDKLCINEKQKTKLGFSIVFVNTIKTLVEMVEFLEIQTIINVDFEGIDLCKTGTVCLGQFHASESDVVYVVDFVDINPFQEADGRLKNILESKGITKIFFDPRNDMDAISNIYKVYPKNVICLQLAEAAYRRQEGLSVKFVFGLHKTMEKYLKLDYESHTTVMNIKNAGKHLFAPECGGSYDVFLKRPLSDNILNYAAIDVYYFDQLRLKLFEKLSNNLRNQVIQLSEKRLVEYQNSNYTPKGREKVFAPSFRLR